jgi:hypothetical protein
MVDISKKLTKTFESINKGLYRSNKAIELYSPFYKIFNDLIKDIKEIMDISKKNEYLNKNIENEIKQRELISLYKKMNVVISSVKKEIDNIYNEMQEGNKFLEKFRSYRSYVFSDTKKSRDYVKKIVDSFGIEQFTLKFNVVGTVDLNEVTSKIKGRKIGIDIIVPSENIDLIYEEILKSKSIKFRLISDSLVIYFEKDNAF